MSACAGDYRVEMGRKVIFIVIFTQSTDQNDLNWDSNRRENCFNFQTQFCPWIFQTKLLIFIRTQPYHFQFGLWDLQCKGVIHIAFKTKTKQTKSPVPSCGEGQFTVPAIYPKTLTEPKVTYAVFYAYILYHIRLNKRLLALVVKQGKCNNML